MGYNIDISKSIYISRALALGFWRKESNVLPINQKKAYTDFYNSARYNDILEPKTTLLIHLAAAMASGCYP